MKKAIEIPNYLGHRVDNGKEFKLHPDAVTQGFALLAMRDSGKSNAAGVMQEIFQLMEVQTIVIDPVAAHIGIRNIAGKNDLPAGPSGLNVLVVGPGGDFEVPVSRGSELADVLMESKMSVVVNLKEANMPQRKEFLTAFLQRLYSKNKTPLHLQLEEADEIIPQQPDNREESAIRHAGRQIVKGGRSSGIGFTIVTQRPAMVDKTSLNQIDNLIVMSMMGAADLETLEKWLKFHQQDPGALKDMIASIPTLKVGEAWFISPRWMKDIVRIQFRKRVTYHAGRTPKRGEAPIEVKQYSIGELADRFKEQLEQKRALKVSEAAQMADMIRKVRDLETQLAQAQKAQPKFDPQKLDAMVARAVEEARNADRKELRVSVGETVKLIDTTIDGLQTFATGLELAAADLQKGRGYLEQQAAWSEAVRASGTDGRKVIQHVQHVQHVHKPRPQLVAKPLPERVAAADGDLSGLRLRIITVLSQFEAMGRPDVGRNALSGLAKARGGYYNNTVRQLKAEGLIDYPVTGRIALTDAGRAVAPPVEKLLTQDDMKQRVRDSLKGLEQRIFDVLYQAWPHPVSREQVSQDAGATGGYYNNTVRMLKRIEVIDYPKTGMLKLADWVMLENS